MEEELRGGELMREEFVRGTFSIIKERFAFVDTEEGEGIFIPKTAFHGAFDGDIVLVRITKDRTAEHGREGEVVEIVSREKQKIVGILERRSDFGFVRPTHAFGKDIYIPRGKMKKAQTGELVVVDIYFWGDKERKPEGEIVEVLGDPYNTKNMVDALIYREGMSEDFPKKVKTELKNIPKTVSEKEISSRRDLRDYSIITIDGEDARDLDDAVYVEKMKNGNYKLLVCIADVSYYIPEDSELDLEARKRGNSVYLVDRVLPMFPKEISNGICSLNEKEDKLCFTCEMEIDGSGKVVQADMYKSVIRSIHRMTYTKVNEMIDGKEETLEEYRDIQDMVEMMLDLSKILRARKYARGSIDFDLSEIKLVLDEEEKVEYVKLRERGEAEKIIEDFMVAANEAVAEKLFWMEIPSVYRVHEKPERERLQKLNESLKNFHYRVHNLEEVHPKQFQEMIEDSKEKGVNLIVHKMILMALKQARYGMENLGHFGLASECYTHFTSPIRRYADLEVHRILHSVLNSYPSGKELSRNAKKLPKICEHISKMERVAMKVEEESVKIKLVEYMMNQVGEEFSAMVTGFSNRRVFFETEEHIEVSWDVVSARHFYEFDEREYAMLDREQEENQYHMGDKVKIVIVKASLQELEIEAVPTLVMQKGW